MSSRPIEGRFEDDGLRDELPCLCLFNAHLAMLEGIELFKPTAQASSRFWKPSLQLKKTCCPRRTKKNLCCARDTIEHRRAHPQLPLLSCTVNARIRLRSIAPNRTMLKDFCTALIYAALKDPNPISGSWRLLLLQVPVCFTELGGLLPNPSSLQCLRQLRNGCIAMKKKADGENTSLPPSPHLHESKDVWFSQVLLQVRRSLPMGAPTVRTSSRRWHHALLPC